MDILSVQENTVMLPLKQHKNKQTKKKQKRVLKPLIKIHLSFKITSVNSSAHSVCCMEFVKDPSSKNALFRDYIFLVRL